MDFVRDAFAWLTDDLDAEDADRALQGVELSVHERSVVAVVRVAFAVLELVMFCGAWVTLPAFFYLFGELFDWAPPWLLLGIVPPAVLWFVLRKPRALAKSALLRAVARRAVGRATMVHDAVSASSSPVAVAIVVAPPPQDGG